MRELHVIGFTSDHGGLILAGSPGAKTGGYLLELDAETLDHIDRARRANGGPGPGSVERPARPPGQSALSPREIQARLRRGRTIPEVAAEAGVGIEWIDRFAAPVLAEQAAAVERARHATLHDPGRGPSGRPLGEAVLRNLAGRPLRLTADEFDAGWSAYQLVDSDWLVSFQFSARGRRLTAEWVFNQAAGTLTPRNRASAELGFVDGAPPPGVDPADPATPADNPRAMRKAAPAHPSTTETAQPRPRRSGSPAQPPLPGLRGDNGRDAGPEQSPRARRNGSPSAPTASTGRRVRGSGPVTPAAAGPGVDAAASPSPFDPAAPPGPGR